jgi:RNA polymerase sigma-70 factor (ECF subfamily)
VVATVTVAAAGAVVVVGAGAVVPAATEVVVSLGLAALLLLPHAASANAATATVAPVRMLKRRLETPLVLLESADLPSTDEHARRFDEPGRPPPRILEMMVEVRPVLANDDGVRTVYAAHGPELYRFALRSLGDRGLAEEAVQEAFVRAWQAAGRFDDALGSLRTWLFAILRNVVIDMSRARAVRPALTAERRANEPIVLDDDVERFLVAWQVEEALQMLSIEHRDALVEVHYKSRPYQEVARDLGVPVGTIKSRVYYALKAMRLALEELGWSDDV